MGTGIASILLNTLPYDGIWLYYLSVIIFALNVLLFSLFCIITALRYLLYPQIFTAMIRHPVQSMFLGTFPMGFATIINMFVLVCVPAWGGDWTRRFAWGMWIFDAIISVLVALTLPALLYVPLPYLIIKLIPLILEHEQDDAHAKTRPLRHDSRLAFTNRQSYRGRCLGRRRRQCPGRH